MLMKSLEMPLQKSIPSNSLAKRNANMIKKNWYINVKQCFLHWISGWNVRRFLNLRGIWHRGVVQKYSRFPVVVSFITECVLHFHIFSRSGARENVIPHGNSNVSVQINLMVVENYFWPTLSPINREATIFCISASKSQDFQNFFTSLKNLKN